MTSRKLSQLDTLDGLQDGDRIYVVRASLDEDERSQAIEVEDAKAYFATDLTDLTARVAALEAGETPTPHSMTRYAALRDDGAMPSDFTAADFLAAPPRPAKRMTSRLRPAMTTRWSVSPSPPRRAL